VLTLNTREQTNLPGCPFGHCCASQFGSVVAPQHRRICGPFGGEAVQIGDQVLAADAAFDQAAERLRVCSSMIETILIGRPSVVTSNWKSSAHTRLGASAVTAGYAGFTAVARGPRRNIGLLAPAVEPSCGVQHSASSADAPPLG
jgi:hypothetical protein